MSRRFQLAILIAIFLPFAISTISAWLPKRQPVAKFVQHKSQQAPAPLSAAERQRIHQHNITRAHRAKITGESVFPDISEINV